MKMHERRGGCRAGAGGDQADIAERGSLKGPPYFTSARAGDCDTRTLDIYMHTNLCCCKSIVVYFDTTQSTCPQRQPHPPSSSARPVREGESAGKTLLPSVVAQEALSRGVGAALHVVLLLVDALGDLGQGGSVARVRVRVRAGGRVRVRLGLG